MELFSDHVGLVAGLKELTKRWLRYLVAGVDREMAAVVKLTAGLVGCEYGAEFHDMLHHIGALAFIVVRYGAGS